MKKNLLIISICIGLFQWLNAQSPIIYKGALNTGFDGRQGFYLGFEHKFNAYALGIDAGTSFGVIYPAQFFSLTLNNNLFFGRPNKYEIKTWYSNIRLTYSQVLEDMSNKPILLSVTPAIGKQFNLNQRYGIGIDIGINFVVMNRNTSSTLIPTGRYFEYSNTVVPSIRLSLFYKY